VRYGVTGEIAIELVTSGVRSRELATVVDNAAGAESIEIGELRNWLGRMTFAGWVERFGATASGLLDLLEYSRTRNAGVLRRLLGDGAASLRLDDGRLIDDRGAGPDTTSDEVTLREIESSISPSPIGVFEIGDDTEPIATVPMSLHADLQSILDTGLELAVHLSEGILTLRLID
jgi:hypothetical protein